MNVFTYTHNSVHNCVADVCVRKHVYIYLHVYRQKHTNTYTDMNVFTHTHTSEHLFVADVCVRKRVYIYIYMFTDKNTQTHTGWRRLIGTPKLQIIFHKRATKYRSLLRKMTYKDKGSYESSPPYTKICMYLRTHTIVSTISLPMSVCVNIYMYIQIYRQKCTNTYTNMNVFTYTQTSGHLVVADICVRKSVY